MFRNALLVSALALGVAGAAQAQAPDTTTGFVPPATGNTVGGGGATIIGGGDNMVIQYSRAGAGGAGGALHAQAPRFARASNGYGDTAVEYLEPETASPGREAWMTGGGDNAQVVYLKPR
jgi:hypothetical protein